MRVTAIGTKTEQKPEERSVSRAEKRGRRTNNGDSAPLALPNPKRFRDRRPPGAQNA